jgi:hypothetical protein
VRKVKRRNIISIFMVLLVSFSFILFQNFINSSKSSSFNSLVIQQNASIQIGATSEKANLVMQSDGNLVFYKNSIPLWTSSTKADCGTNNCFAVLQGDGNLVVYNKTKALWSTGTSNNPGATLTVSTIAPLLQITDSAHEIIWSTSDLFTGRINGSQMIVLKNGKGTCNSNIFSQIPDHLDYFLGRITNTDTCTGNESWSLALFKKDGNVFNYVNTIYNTAEKSTAGAQKLVINTAYDPNVVKDSNGQLWVSFECFSSQVEGSAAACLGPYTFNKTIDQSRTNLVVSGTSSDPNSSEWFSASVPKLLYKNGLMYMYWTAVQIHKNPNCDESSFPIKGVSCSWKTITGRGMQLELESSGRRSFYGKNASGKIVSSYDQKLNTEVMGLEPNDPMTNSTMDIFQVILINDQIYGAAGVGGSGCLTPVAGAYGSNKALDSYGCYKTRIFKADSPLGYHVFNKFKISQQDSNFIPFNPQEYTRFFQDEAGQFYLMGTYFKTTANNLPDNTIKLFTNNYSVMLSFPYDLSKIEFQESNKELVDRSCDLNASKLNITNNSRYVDYLYCLVLGRNADSQGKQTYINFLQEKSHFSDAALSMFNSSEIDKKKSLNQFSNEEFVRYAYQNILGRNPDENGNALHVKLLNEGHDGSGNAFTRDTLITNLLNSTELNSQEKCSPDQIYPNWGVNNGVCLKSCGGLGGLFSSQATCSSKGRQDVGPAYDTPFCCK